jgi:hydrogenase maturation protein HypF
MENKSIQRLAIAIQGAVQGVGFRPFIYRLARDLGLVGWVKNSAGGVSIEVEGNLWQLETFMQRLELEKPPLAGIQNLESLWLDPIGYSTFAIETSATGEKTATVLPDIATCGECLQEIFNPSDRRYRYPFTNCTNCGPRFSLLESLPYDRPQTTMKHFQMCDRCRAEYENPSDRRFHAQPNACHQCGPHLEFWDRQGQILASYEDALQMAATAIRQGQIFAVKGLGGFHLLVDARNETAVQRLRQAKRREAKPLALMYPSLEQIQAHCQVSNLEAQLLRSPAAPIVLLKRQELTAANSPSPFVAPNNPYLGVMLPYTPLHHLLLAELGFPIVATSGNLSDEPICTNEHEAVGRLQGIADGFLVHNRPIARPIDDSIVTVVMGQEMMLRRSRGYAPLPVVIGGKTSLPTLWEAASTSTPRLRHPSPKLGRGEGVRAGFDVKTRLEIESRILAVGAHLKNAIAISLDRQVFISQHLGDLETVPAFEAFQAAIASWQELYELNPAAIACDLHPDYRSTQFARQFAERLGIPLIAVQHHYAHVLSCMADNQLSGSVLGIAWDGTGYGLDGTIWGGEFIHVTETSWQRVAYLRPFPLPGGEKAVKEPRRSAIGLLYQLLGDEAFDLTYLPPIQAFCPQDLKILKTMLDRQIDTPVTSSVGRLFDAIASIVGLRQRSQFEGQAAMELEFSADELQTSEYYGFDILKPDSASVVNWQPALQEILDDSRVGLSVATISRKFHRTMVEIIVAIAKQVGEERVVLTGGCFQNKFLSELATQRLKAEGFCPYQHRQIPPNDGGIALGQIAAAQRELSRGLTNSS